MRNSPLLVSRPPLGLVLLLALLLPSAQAQAQSPSRTGVYAEMQVEAWSNGLPVLDINGDWTRGYERRDGRQRAYAQGRAEVGGQFNPVQQEGWNPWRLGLLARADASARLSGDAAQVLYHYQSRTDPDQPGTYNADTDLMLWSGRGVAVHTPTLSLGAFKLDAGWDHMTLQRLRSLQSRGQVTYNADNSYSYEGKLHDDNSKSTPLFMVPPSARGVGDALSLRLSWVGSTGADRAVWLPDRLQVKVDDLWSRLHWSGINGDDAVLNSNVSTRTSDGYIEYRAAINGQYTRRTLVERIPTSSQVQMGWSQVDGEWTLRLKNRLGLWQHWIGWQSHASLAWRLAVEPVAGALSMGVDWYGLSATFMTDRLSNEAHVRGGQLSWAAAF